jgi:cytochrome c-type biogenesis protein CcmH
MTRLIRLVPLLALGLLLLQVHQGAAASDALERQINEIAKQLRCPVCQNLSIADTPSKLGENMRALIREQLERGLTSEEVIAYFVSKYGKWILLEPEHRGFNLIVWWGPVLALLGGLTGLILMVRRWVRATPLPTNPQAPPALYLDQVRRDLANLAVSEEDR